MAWAGTQQRVAGMRSSVIENYRVGIYELGVYRRSILPRPTPGLLPSHGEQSSLSPGRRQGKSCLAL